MLIDIEKAKIEFKKYIKNYNPEDEQVKLKISHIERTSQVAKKTAEKLNLNKEDIELAELIGLLHDIGRFEQIRKYHTFIDKISVNHGELGVKILFDDGLIRNFIKDDKYDKIIKLAILNHNKAKIQDGLSEKELLHAKIIRDADKTDIFYTLTFGDIKSIYESYDISNQEISKEIYREFIEDKIMNYKYIQTGADILVAHFAYVYDFNFKYGLQNIYEKRYIDKLYSRFHFNNVDTQTKYEKVYQYAKEYTNEKVKS